MYLGSNRVVTNPFSSHVTAEDYAGDHKSNVSINGVGIVTKIINRFTSHEDSINYNDYINNRSSWKDGNYYNCVSLTGKTVRMHYMELGGNQVFIETYDNGNKITFRIAHLDSVNVNVGDIVDSNTIIGYQGNTGLVLSSKDRSNPTYGSHVHFEVTNSSGEYLNPRNYAEGNIVTTYIEQSNTLDTSKEQFQIIVDKINIRSEASEFSTDLGDVFDGEIYTIQDKVDTDIYTWYKITTNRGLTGYVASKKGENWVKLLKSETDIVENVGNNDEEKVVYEYLFTCPKDDLYYVKLYKGEELYLKKMAE